MVVDLNTERQNEQFGGMNREKIDILSTITAKNMTKNSKSHVPKLQGEI